MIRDFDTISIDPVLQIPSKNPLNICSVQVFMSVANLGTYTLDLGGLKRGSDFIGSFATTDNE